MQAADLALWSPVRLNVSDEQPSIDWCDFSEAEFTEPFFSQSIDRILTQDPETPLLRTTLSALAEIEADRPGRDPDGLIFHAARCGSTLASSLAAKLPSVAVISEPEPLNALLELDPKRSDRAVKIECIRLLMRAYGRARPRAKRVIFKLSSWNIMLAPLIASAFPTCPRVFIYRDPLEILASLLGDPPGWTMLRSHDPAKAAWMLDVDGTAEQSEVAFTVAALASLMKAALQADDAARMLLVNYSDLPGALWQQIMPHFGRMISPDEQDSLVAASQWNAKDPKTKFVADSGAKRRNAAAELAYSVASRIDPLYTELQRRRKLGIL